MATMKQMKDETRAMYVEKLMSLMIAEGEDVARTGAGEFNMPVVLEDGTETWVVVKVSLPSGARDGEPYDGYDMRDEYELKQAEKADKAAEAARKKALKIERDKASRAAKAAAKAKRAEA